MIKEYSFTEPLLTSFGGDFHWFSDKYLAATSEVLWKTVSRWQVVHYQTVLVLHDGNHIKSPILQMLPVIKIPIQEPDITILSPSVAHDGIPPSPYSGLTVIHCRCVNRGREDD